MPSTIFKGATVSLIPLRDVVIIELDDELEVGGGIVLPESVKDPAGTQSGTIRNINFKYRTNDTDSDWTYQREVTVGDRVLFLRKHGIVIKGKKKHVCVRYENLLAVFED